MSDPNFVERAGEFGLEAAIDTAANKIANEAIHAVASHIPGGQSVEQMLDTEVDLVLDNSINAQVNERIEGVEEMFGQHPQPPRNHHHHHHQE
jgi:hypothetical protein